MSDVSTKPLKNYSKKKAELSKILCAKSVDVKAIYELVERLESDHEKLKVFARECVGTIENEWGEDYDFPSTEIQEILIEEVEEYEVTLNFRTWPE
jgi:N6-adenosine-specific RNA methylase IME4